MSIYICKFIRLFFIIFSLFSTVSTHTMQKKLIPQLQRRYVLQQRQMCIPTKYHEVDEAIRKKKKYEKKYEEEARRRREAQDDLAMQLTMGYVCYKIVNENSSSNRHSYNDHTSHDNEGYSDGDDGGGNSSDDGADD